MHGMTATTGEQAVSAPETRGGIPADTFGNRLVLARAYAGHLSINEAADRCKGLGVRIGRGAWANWEKGARPFDMLAVVEIISEQLGVDADWLLNGGPLVEQHRRKVRWRRDEATVTESELGFRDITRSRPPGHPVTSTRSTAGRRPQRRTRPVGPVYGLAG